MVAIVIGRTMPASWMNDFLSMVFRAFFRLEVKGLENIDKAGPNAIIALNHVSFLDPPLAMAILPKRPVFAIDVAMSKHWWIQPLLKVMRTMALDPLKPYGDAHHHQCGARRRHAGDFSRKAASPSPAA